VIPSIEEILAAVHSLTMTPAEGVVLINKHLELAADADAFVLASLSGLVQTTNYPVTHVDIVANAAYKLARRLLEVRNAPAIAAARTAK
jgi:hypothetical protein